MYNPVKVSRQFGFYQTIPPFLRCTDEALNGIKKGNGDDWLTRYSTYMHAWDRRWNLLLADQRPFDPSRCNKNMRWYSGASILYLQAWEREPNTYGERIRQMVTRIAEKFKNIALGGGCRALGCCLGTTPEDPCEQDARDMFAPPDDKMKYMLVDQDELGESSCPGAKRERIFTSIKRAKRSKRF